MPTITTGAASPFLPGMVADTPSSKPVSWTCDDHVVHLVFAFRLPNADDLQPDTLNGTASALRKHLLSLRWGDVLEQLAGQKKAARKRCEEDLRKLQEKLNADPKDRPTHAALARANSDLMHAQRVELALTKFANSQPEALHEPASAGTDTEISERNQALTRAPSEVWRAIEPNQAHNQLHHDLVAVVGELLHGGKVEKDSNANVFLGLPPIEVHLPRLLNSQKFAVSLRGAALDRLDCAGISRETAGRLGLTVLSVKLYFMASGIIIVAMGLRFCELGKQMVKARDWESMPNDSEQEKAARSAAKNRADKAAAHAVSSVPHALLEEGLYALGHAPDRGQVLTAVRVLRPRAVTQELPAGRDAVLDPRLGHAARLAGEADYNDADGTGAVKQGAPREVLQTVNPYAWGSKDTAPGSADPRPPLLLVDDLGRLALGQLLEALMDFSVSESSDVTERGEHRGDGLLSQLQPVGDRDHGRVFTFCAAIYGAETPDSELPTLAYTLSRRFGSDYQIAPEDVTQTVVRTFENVSHAMATQGAAITLRQSGAAFIEAFCSSAVPSTYLPLAILNYHEYLHLLHLTQECAFMPNVKEPKCDKDRLVRMRVALAAFRLYFRFGHVSDLAHHNQVHRAWRNALELDRMLQDLVLDVREAEQVLSQIHRTAEQERHDREAKAEQERQERDAKTKAHWRRVTGIGMCLLSTSVAMHVLEAAHELYHPSRAWILHLMNVDVFANAESCRAMGHSPLICKAVEIVREAHHLEGWSFLLAVVVGVVLGTATYRSGGKGGEGH